MADVIVSRAEPDALLAGELGQRLEALGLSVIDETKIDPGDTWQTAIENAYPHAMMVVLLWSNNAATAERMNSEVHLAVRAWSHDRLLLVRLDNAPLPTGLGGLPAMDITTTAGGLSADDREAIATAISRKTTPASAPPKSRRRWVTVLVSALAVLAIGSMAWLFTQGVPRQGVPPDEKSGAQVPPIASIEVPGSVLELTDTSLAIILGAVAVLISFIVLIRQHSGKWRPRPPGPGHAEAQPAQETGSPAETAARVDPIDLFVSYSRADVRSIDPLIEHIREHGLNIWIDTQRQDGDARYAGHIVRAIRGCRSVLIMCSENAYRSDHVVREVYVSGDYKKPFIVVQLDDAEFPDDFQYFLSGFPRIKLEEFAPEQFASKITALIPA